jgi:hypothetical protein
LHSVLELFLCARFALAVVFEFVVRGDACSCLISWPAQAGACNTIVPVYGIRMDTVQRVFSVYTFGDLVKETYILLKEY